MIAYRQKTLIETGPSLQRIWLSGGNDRYGYGWLVVLWPGFDKIQLWDAISDQVTITRSAGNGLRILQGRRTLPRNGKTCRWSG